MKEKSRKILRRQKESKILKMFTTFIIDDENPARLRIKKLLESHASLIEVIGEADCGKDAIEQIEKLRPQVLF